MKNSYIGNDPKKLRALLRKILWGLKRKRKITKFSFEKSITKFPYCSITYKSILGEETEVRISFMHSPHMLSSGFAVDQKDQWMNKEPLIYTKFKPKELFQIVAHTLQVREKGLLKEKKSHSLLSTLHGVQNIRKIIPATADENISGADYFIIFKDATRLGINIKSSRTGVAVASTKHKNILNFHMKDSYFLSGGVKIFRDDFLLKLYFFINPTGDNIQYRPTGT